MRLAPLRACAAALALLGADCSFDLVRAPPEIVALRGAACLDGSAPGVYFMPGTDVNKWRVHFHGGGWRVQR